MIFECHSVEYIVLFIVVVPLICVVACAMQHIQIKGPQFDLHSAAPEREYVARVWKSENHFLVKVTHVLLLVMIISPAYWFLRSWFSSPLFLIYFYCMNSVIVGNPTFLWLAFFSIWYLLVVLVASLICIFTKMFPSLVSTLHLYMYGNDLTTHFWNNQGSKTGF